MYGQSEDQHDTNIRPGVLIGRKLGLCDGPQSGKQNLSDLLLFFSGTLPLQRDIFPNLWDAQTANSDHFRILRLNIFAWDGCIR